MRRLSSAQIIAGVTVSQSQKQLIKASRHWLVDLASFAVKTIAGRRPRFCVLTPPFANRQSIFDARSGSVIRVQIRNVIDYLVVRQIFAMNDYGFEKLTRCGELLEGYADLVAAGLQPLIIDCGANSGMATRFFAETFPAAQLVAVEPDGANMAMAKVNNSKHAARFYQAGIGAESAVGRFTDAAADNWAFTLVHDPLGDVHIISVNSILDECCTDGVVPFIVKIDIEGFESDLFERNIEWIDRFPILVIELHDWLFPKSAKSRAFLKAISNCDRDFVYHGENVFSISNSPGMFKSPAKVVAEPVLAGA